MARPAGMETPRSIPARQSHYEDAHPEMRFVRGVRTVFLGAVGSGWGALLLFVSLVVALSFLGVLWWLSDLFYDVGWWPLGVLTRIVIWVIGGVIALRLLFLLGKGAVIIGRWLWRLSDHIVRPKIPASVGAEFIILMLAVSVGGGLYFSFSGSDDTPSTQLAPSALYPTLRHLNRILARWAGRKYTRLGKHRRRAMHWLGRIATRQPALFAHWHLVPPEVGR